MITNFTTREWNYGIKIDKYIDFLVVLIYWNYIRKPIRKNNQIQNYLKQFNFR